MSGYYEDKLSAVRLKRCYEVATQRVKQYLRAEISHVLKKIRSGDIILELGCGYGRVLSELAQRAGTVIGIDTSLASLVLAQKIFPDIEDWYLMNMDAVQLGFHDHLFDCVICIQNGISAFHVDHQKLIRESIRVTKPGGTVLFSSYSDKFWEARLKWFQIQSEAGLLGDIDHEKTRDGMIICKDGFTAATVRPNDFLELTKKLDGDVEINEIDESSLFCEISL